MGAPATYALLSVKAASTDIHASESGKSRSGVVQLGRDPLDFELRNSSGLGQNTPDRHLRIGGWVPCPVPPRALEEIHHEAE